MAEYDFPRVIDWSTVAESSCRFIFFMQEPGFDFRDHLEPVTTRQSSATVRVRPHFISAVILVSLLNPPKSTVHTENGPAI